MENPEDPSLPALAVELRVLASRLRRKLRAEGGSIGEFTPSQIEVLRRLDSEGPATVAALARAADMRPQSMGAIVATLEAAGLIAGTPDPADGRRTLFDLTEACRERVARNRAGREDWLLRTLRAEFSAEEQRQLATGVALLQRLVES